MTPSPSSSPLLPTSPSPSPTTTPNSSPALIAALVAFALLALLATAYAYFTRTQSDELKSTAEVQMGELKKTIEKLEAEKKQAKEDAERKAKAKANQVLPASAAAAVASGGSMLPGVGTSRANTTAMFSGFTSNMGNAAPMSLGNAFGQAAMTGQGQFGNNVQGFKIAPGQPSINLQGFKVAPGNPSNNLQGFNLGAMPGTNNAMSMGFGGAPLGSVASTGQASLAQGNIFSQPMTPASSQALTGGDAFASLPFQVSPSPKVMTVEAASTKKGGYASGDALKLYTRLKIGYGEIVVGKKLGSGAYGSVHRCAFKGYDKFAVKQLTKLGADNDKVRKAFMKEVKIMCSLSHPCTIRLYAWIENPPAVIMELAICDLRQYYTGNEKGERDIWA